MGRKDSSPDQTTIIGVHQNFFQKNFSLHFQKVAGWFLFILASHIAGQFQKIKNSALLLH